MKRQAAFRLRALSATDIPFLVATAEVFLEHIKITRFHLMGHSMGGLTALYLAHRNPDRVLSFADIKGNLAPEDCFLSRQIFTFKSDDPEDFSMPLSTGPEPVGLMEVPCMRALFGREFVSKRCDRFSNRWCSYLMK